MDITPFYEPDSGTWTYLLADPASGSAAVIDPVWTSSGDDMAEVRYGWSVAGVGDVNNDGFDDVVVSAPWFNTGNTAAGKIYLYYKSDFDGDPLLVRMQGLAIADHPLGRDRQPLDRRGREIGRQRRLGFFAQRR